MAGSKKLVGWAVGLLGVYVVLVTGDSSAHPRSNFKGTRYEKQANTEYQPLESAPISEVDYVEGPLAPLYDFLIQHRLHRFCKLLRDAGLEQVIKDLGGSWTLFAPNDASFIFLPGGTLEELQRNPQLLRDFILYHFVIGDFPSSQIENELLVESVQGSPLRFNIYGQTLTVSGAEILQPDLLFDMGRVYIVDRPLYPIPSEDIITYLQKNHREMYKLVVHAGMVDYLSSGTFTLLVPDDQAFGYLTAELKDALATNISLAERILFNHILPGSLYVGGVVDGMQWETVGGSAVTFNIKRGLTFVNDIPVILPDVPLTNGVIHVLNRVLLPEGIDADCHCKPSSDTNKKPGQISGGSRSSFGQPQRPSYGQGTTTRRPGQSVPIQTPRPGGQIPSTTGVSGQRGSPVRPQSPGISSTQTVNRPPFSPSRTGQPVRPVPPPSQITGSPYQPESVPDEDINNVVGTGVQTDSGQRRPDQTRTTRYPPLPPLRQRPTPRPPQSVASHTTRRPQGGAYPGSEIENYPEQEVTAGVSHTTRQADRWSDRQRTPAPRYPTPQRGQYNTPTIRRPHTTRTYDWNQPRVTQPSFEQPDQDTGIDSSTGSLEQGFQTQRPVVQTTSWQQRKQVTQTTRQPSHRTTFQPSRQTSPPQRRTTTPRPSLGRSTVMPQVPGNEQPFEPARQQPNCRRQGDRITNFNRNLPLCSGTSPNGCQNSPYNPSDARPLCPESETQDCRRQDDPYSPSDNRPLCPSLVPTEDCREFGQPTYIGDRRPLCAPSSIPQTGCKDPLLPYNPSDRRPVCRTTSTPAIVSPSTQGVSSPEGCRRPNEVANPQDRRPLCSPSSLPQTGCKDPSTPYNPSDRRPICRTTSAPAIVSPSTQGVSSPEGCRRPNEVTNPQDRRPLCPEEPEQDCRPLLERPRPGDRRPVCKINQSNQRPKPTKDADKIKKKPEIPQQQTPYPQRGQSPTQTTRRQTWQSTTRAPQSWQTTRQPVGKQPQTGISQAPPHSEIQNRPQTDSHQSQSGSYPLGPQTGRNPSQPQSGSYPTQPQPGSHPSQPQTGTDVQPQPGDSIKPQTGVYPSGPQSGTQPTQQQTGRYPSQPQSGRYPSQQQPGRYPSQQQSGRYPTHPQTGTQTTAPQSGSYPSQQPGSPQSGSYPSQPQTGSYPSQQPGSPQSGSYPSQPQSGAYPSRQPGTHSGSYPSQPQSGSYPSQQQGRPSSGSYPSQPQSGSYPAEQPRSPNTDTHPVELDPPQPEHGSHPSQPHSGIHTSQPQPGSLRPSQPTSGPWQSQPARPTPGYPQRRPGSQQTQSRFTTPTPPSQTQGARPSQPFTPQGRPVSGQGHQTGSFVPGPISPRRPTTTTTRVPISVTGTSTTPSEDSRRTLYEIVEDPALLIRGRPVQLKKIFEMFHKAGIEDILTGPGPTTVFLPSDDAFALLPKGVVEQLEENPELLRQVLLYHVTQTEILPSAQPESYTVPSLEGNQLVITMLNGGRLIFVSGAKAVAVTKANNGIFYVINQLLYPLPHQDIVGAIQSRPDLSTLAYLLPLSGLEDLLRGQTPYTLLAPTDNAFAQLPQSTYEELTRNASALQEILLNHIIEGAHYGREFFAGGTFPSARGGKLKFQVVSYGYQVNDVNIKTPEIVTGSGVIHLIDQILLEEPDLQYFTGLENSVAGEDESLTNTQQPGQQGQLTPAGRRPISAQQFTGVQQPGVNQPQIGGLQPSVGQPAPVARLPSHGQGISGSQPTSGQPHGASFGGQRQPTHGQQTPGQSPGPSAFGGRQPSTQGVRQPVQGQFQPSRQPIQPGQQPTGQHVSGQPGHSSFGGQRLPTHGQRTQTGTFTSQRRPVTQTGSHTTSGGHQGQQGTFHTGGQPNDVADLARSMGLNQFANWITNTGLLEKIHDGGVYTVFAPTDDAVNSLPQDMVYSIDSNPQQVKPILEYHIVPQRLNLNSVRNEETASTLLRGKTIRFNVYQNSQPDCKQLVTASGTPVGEALATMGSIQVIPVTQVLYQPAGNLQKIVEASPILQKLNEAVKSARLSWILSGNGPMTIFAPSDTAFDSLTEEEKKTLLEDKQAFSELLKRHIVRGTYFSSGIQDDLEKKSENNKPIKLSLQEGILTVNSVPVTYSDITATNGVLHVIDQFL